MKRNKRRYLMNTQLQRCFFFRFAPKRPTRLTSAFKINYLLSVTRLSRLFPVHSEQRFSVTTQPCHERLVMSHSDRRRLDGWRNDRAVDLSASRASDSLVINFVRERAPHCNSCVLVEGQDFSLLNWSVRNLKRWVFLPPPTPHSFFFFFDNWNHIKMHLVGMVQLQVL